MEEGILCAVLCYKSASHVVKMLPLYRSTEICDLSLIPIISNYTVILHTRQSQWPHHLSHKVSAMALSSA